MDDIYEIIENQPSEKETNTLTDEFDKEAWSARKQAERADAYQKIDDATQRISSDPEEFKTYLDILAQQGRYSVSNTLLIFEQRPEAIQLGDFEYWKAHGASVRRGEQSIVILEPGNEYTRDDGSTGLSYNIKKVFDVTQTTAHVREPRTYDIRLLLKGLVHNAPADIKTVDELPSQTYARYDHEDKTISVLRGLESAPLFRVLSVEIAHAHLAHNSEEYNRGDNEGTALFASYVLSRQYGVNPSGLESALASISGTDSLQEIREELGRIRLTARDMSEQIQDVLEQSKSARKHAIER
jgi:hypothetical protein